jgi:dTDP-4-dehydrorhamnose reductase
MKLAWITGAQGLIGSQLVRLAAASAPGWRVRGIARSDFDLLDGAAMEREFLRDQPQLIIHCAAVSTIAEAQKNPELARRVNVEATACLAELAGDVSFVFFSTDLVFDGRQGMYLETAATNPLSFYGETKLAAEQAVLKNPRHLVVRTSINGGISRSGTRGFNEQLRQALQKAGGGMKLFTDEFRSPVPAAETARAVWELALKGCCGIYHVAGAERLSRWEMGQLLVARWPELVASIEAGSARDFPGPPRALDTSLNIAKAQAVLSRPLPGLSAWLTAHPAEVF